MNKFFKIPEPVIGLLLVVVAALFLFKESLVMPMGMEGLLLVLFLIAFLMYVGIMWNEKAGDEREGVHILQAGRNSYLVGVAVLVVGIVRESLVGDIDPWLIAGLIGMVVSKVISRIYSQVKN